LEDDLVAWGRVLRIETTGRVTGRPARATVGFEERDDGTLVVAAGSPSASWSLNLLHDPACRVTIADASWAAVARPLDGPAHAAAVRDLILKYGTPAEGLGAGPSFELRRAGVIAPDL
jgi:deazaflavin-dependent oxidoreductase (nitroreductase family)